MTTPSGESKQKPQDKTTSKDPRRGDEREDKATPSRPGVPGETPLAQTTSAPPTSAVVIPTVAGSPEPPLPVDIAPLTDEQLGRLIAGAQSLLEERRAKKQSEFLASVRAQATALGLDPVAIAAALGKRARPGNSRGGDKRVSVKPKYRNPANPSQTWAGRGATPAWIELGGDNKPLPKFLIAGA